MFMQAISTCMLQTEATASHGCVSSQSDSAKAASRPGLIDTANLQERTLLLFNVLLYAFGGHVLTPHGAFLVLADVRRGCAKINRSCQRTVTLVHNFRLAGPVRTSFRLSAIMNDSCNDRRSWNRGTRQVQWRSEVRGSDHCRRAQPSDRHDVYLMLYEFVSCDDASICALRDVF